MGPADDRDRARALAKLMSDVLGSRVDVVIAQGVFMHVRGVSADDALVILEQVAAEGGRSLPEAARLVLSVF